MSFWWKSRGRFDIPSIILYLLAKGSFQTPLFINQWEKDIYGYDQDFMEIHEDFMGFQWDFTRTFMAG